jgi:Aldehyde dehydrogenase family
MNKISMLINGEPMQASTGATFARANPLDGTSATIAPAASVDDAVAAVAAAAAAFREWSLKGPGERRKLLMKAAQALEARLADFAAAMAAETGASAIWAGFNVHLAADMLLEAASLTTQIDGELIPSDLPGSLSMALGFSVLGLLIVAKEHEGAASIAGGILGIFLVMRASLLRRASTGRRSARYCTLERLGHSRCTCNCGAARLREHRCSQRQ